jgi:hypothetical protein
VWPRLQWIPDPLAATLSACAALPPCHPPIRLPVSRLNLTTVKETSSVLLRIVVVKCSGTCDQVEWLKNERTLLRRDRTQRLLRTIFWGQLWFRKIQTYQNLQIAKLHKVTLAASLSNKQIPCKIFMYNKRWLHTNPRIKLTCTKYIDTFCIILRDMHIKRT